jgi:hypothetical protein
VERAGGAITGAASRGQTLMNDMKNTVTRFMRSGG